MSPQYNKHFTLDEAIALLPFIREFTEKTHHELDEIKQGIVLYRRMLDMEDNLREDLLKILEDKVHQYETLFNGYIDTLGEKGIEVKDVEKGLVDFPYLSQSGEEYFLCWHLGEDALFYFHEIESGFAGRTPITLLPE